MGGAGQVNLGGWDRRRLLVILGCVVTAASSGEQALLALDARAVDADRKLTHLQP